MLGCGPPLLADEFDIGVDLIPCTADKLNQRINNCPTPAIESSAKRLKLLNEDGELTLIEYRVSPLIYESEASRIGVNELKEPGGEIGPLVVSQHLAFLVLPHNADRHRKRCRSLTRSG